jgi:benzoate/toluate 1,2-dioxygenase subunit beta
MESTYLKGRSHLEDRVFRLQTGDSFASVPMARTTHVVGNVLITAVDRHQIDVRASWIVHSFGIHGPLTRSGSYEYQLRQRDEVLRIARRKVTIIDEKLVGPVDVLHV